MYQNHRIDHLVFNLRLLSCEKIAPIPGTLTQINIERYSDFCSGVVMRAECLKFSFKGKLITSLANRF